MAVDVKRITIGAPTVSVATWVAAGAASSFTDFGLTGPVEVIDSVEKYIAGDGEQVPTGQRAVEIKREVEIKVELREGALDLLQQILEQAAARLTGTNPNKTLLVGEGTEGYLTIKIDTKGEAGGTSYIYAAQAWTFYRCHIKSRDPITISKGKEKTFSVTLGVLWDTTVTTADKLYKVVSSGGS